MGGPHFVGIEEHPREFGRSVICTDETKDRKLCKELVYPVVMKWKICYHLVESETINIESMTYIEKLRSILVGITTEKRKRLKL